MTSPFAGRGSTTSGKLTEPARFTVFLNGILVQNNEEPWGGTSWLEPYPYDPSVQSGPIQLQDHSHPVRFRNIWVRNLPDRPAPSSDDLKRPEIVELAPAALDSCTGRYAADRKRDEPFVIAREASHLLFKLPFRPTPLRLDPISETVFFLPHTDGQVTFRKDSQGRVTAALFRVGDGERLLTKVAP